MNGKCNWFGSGIAGDECIDTDDCQEGLVCSPSGGSKVCANEPATCSSHSDCSSVAICNNGACCDYMKPCNSEQQVAKDKFENFGETSQEFKMALGAYYCSAYGDQPDWLASINVDCCVPFADWPFQEEKCCATSDFCSHAGSCSSASSTPTDSSSGEPSFTS